jgi:hypothetical protein
VRVHRMRRRAPLALPAAPSREGAADPPCVVYLIHKLYCPGSLREFAAALRAHPPGCACEVVVLVKGFASPAEARPHLEDVADLADEVMFVPDRGFDLGSYLHAAAQLRRHRYCFMKSQCRPLADGWLAKLDAALDQAGVGQVGCTGAATSAHSWLLHSLGLPSAYRGLTPPRRETRRILGEMLAEQVGLDRRPSRASLARSLWMRLRTLPNVPRELLAFEPFPTFHVRTSMFMLTHAALGELRLREVHTKRDAYGLESGRESFTRQLRRIGLASLVVDRAGVAYEPERWHRSRTYWQGDQEGLLVAENATDCYAVGDLARRRLLSALAWGPHADPSPAGGEVAAR